MYDTHFTLIHIMYIGAYGEEKGTRGDRPQRGRGEVMECMGAMVKGGVSGSR